MHRIVPALLLLAAGWLMGDAGVARATRCLPPTTVAILELESTRVDGAPSLADPPDDVRLILQGSSSHLRWIESSREHQVLLARAEDE